MPLFGALHLSLLALIAAVCVALSLLCRRGFAVRPIRLSLGAVVIVNELVWTTYRYAHEGLHLTNLPLQLCDASLWATAVACLTLSAPLVEFAYFAGWAGAGMALVTPDLWRPCPSYPSIYFFIAHGGIVAGVSVLVFGRVRPLRAGAVWRAYGMLLGYAACVGLVDALTGANYMYLRAKPKGASLLDSLGPWPVYLIPAAVLGFALFWILWLPVRPDKARKIAAARAR